MLNFQDKLPFPFDVESIIDDWVLLGFLVGNDFLPHLPYLHINKSALSTLHNTYMKVLPSMDGKYNSCMSSLVCEVAYSSKRQC